MDVLIVGGGGREHAIAWKLAQSSLVDKIYAAPGNGGMAELCSCVPIGVMEAERLRDFAKEHKVGLVVVASDDPLVAGTVDIMQAAGLTCFGPVAAAAQIEGSKAFSKQLMQDYGIPTAAYATFTDADAAKAYIKQQNKYPTVIKADGLALGKGVIIAQTEDEAMSAIDDMMTEHKFGKSGNTVVIEEFLTGPEVSVLCFTDGVSMLPMASSMDHKRAGDGDTGLNTGGMGVIAPNPYYTPEIAAVCTETIFLPTMAAMNACGRTFRGCLYFGLMLTADGPKVIEYNCRFGDPETQAVLPLLNGDLAEIMLKTAASELCETDVRIKPGAAACVVIASGGYPVSYEKGKEITVGDVGDATVFHAGTKLADGRLVTSGGRVLGVTATAPTLGEAIEKAYAAAAGISFDGAFMRSDIGKKALECEDIR